MLLLNLSNYRFFLQLLLNLWPSLDGWNSR